MTSIEEYLARDIGLYKLSLEPTTEHEKEQLSLAMSQKLLLPSENSQEIEEQLKLMGLIALTYMSLFLANRPYFPESVQKSNQQFIQMLRGKDPVKISVEYDQYRAHISSSDNPKPLLKVPLFFHEMAKENPKAHLYDVAKAAVTVYPDKKEKKKWQGKDSEGTVYPPELYVPAIAMHGLESYLQKYPLEKK